MLKIYNYISEDSKDLTNETRLLIATSYEQFIHKVLYYIEDDTLEDINENYNIFKNTKTFNELYLTFIKEIKDTGVTFDSEDLYNLLTSNRKQHIYRCKVCGDFSLSFSRTRNVNCDNKITTVPIKRKGTKQYLASECYRINRCYSAIKCKRKKDKNNA